MTDVTTSTIPAQAENDEVSSGSGTTPYLLMPITVLFVLLIIAVVRSPSLMTSSGIGAAIIVSAPLILATYALMTSVTAGRGTVDLAIGPLIGFINVSVIQLTAAEVIGSPISVFIFAIGLGIAYQVLMAAIVIYVRVQPIIVSLSGFLALSGINLVILPRPGGLAPEWMQSWGAGIDIISPVLVILVVATLAWLLFTQTAFYTHLRLMGSDERAAYTSGVPITTVRFGAHAIAGVFAGLSAITYTALISSGDPSQGTTYTLIAVTALVLGGTSLAGGRGTVMGSLFGALNLYLITYVLATFNFGAVQSFVTDLAYGTILVVSLLLTIALPFIQRHIRNFSPLLYFVVLSVVVFGVILHTTFDYTALEAATDTAKQALPAMNFAAPLEVVQLSESDIEYGAFAQPLIYAAILIIALPILLRVIFSNSDFRNIGLLVAIFVTSMLLMSGYFLTQNSDSSQAPIREQAN
ncbi:MAG: ABC transporter permease [Hyphomicrobiales bacterium]